jgi:hypothetical protein
MLIENKHVSIEIRHEALGQYRRGVYFDKRIRLSLASEYSRRTAHPKVSALIFKDSRDRVIFQCGATCYAPPAAVAKHGQPSPTSGPYVACAIFNNLPYGSRY